MDLKELRYFRAIAQCGTFSKAAAHLRVAQPALSRQIRKLEHDLGVELFRRTSKGVTPTEAGRLLLERTVKIEHDIEGTRREVVQMAERAAGLLRVGIQAPLSLVLAPELVGAYRATYPEVKLELTEGFHRHLTDGLLDNRIDVAILEMPTHLHAELRCFPLWVETLQLISPRQRSSGGSDTSGAAGPVSLEEVARLPIIAPGRAHAIRRIIDTSFERNQLRFDPVIEANGALMIFELVKAGYGHTIMPESSCWPAIQSGELQAVSIRPGIRRTISLIAQAGSINERTVASCTALVALAPGIAGSRRFGPAALYRDEAAPEVMPRRHGTARGNVLGGPSTT